MTLMPTLHVRDPRRRYRANQIRKRAGASIPPPVVVPINPALVDELTRVDARTRTQFLQRIEREKGSAHAQALLSAVAAALREKRQK